MTKREAKRLATLGRQERETFRAKSVEGKMQDLQSSRRFVDGVDKYANCEVSELETIAEFCGINVVQEFENLGIAVPDEKGIDRDYVMHMGLIRVLEKHFRG